jgi:anti-sigma B factor antagonist
MVSQPLPNGLEVETVGAVTVVRFTRHSFLPADLVNALTGQLLRRADETGCCHVVLNLANVEGLTTAIVGGIVQLQHKLEDGGGRLVLCNVDPFLYEIFKVLNLTGVFKIHADEPSALRAFEVG